MKAAILFHLRFFGLCFLYFIGPTVIWCLSTGAVVSLAVLLFNPGEAGRGVGIVIVFGPTPILLLLGTGLAYFFYAGRAWDRDDGMREAFSKRSRDE